SGRGPAAGPTGGPSSRGGHRRDRLNLAGVQVPRLIVPRPSRSHRGPGTDRTFWSARAFRDTVRDSGEGDADAPASGRRGSQPAFLRNRGCSSGTPKLRIAQPGGHPALFRNDRCSSGTLIGHQRLLTGRTARGPGRDRTSDRGIMSPFWGVPACDVACPLTWAFAVFGVQLVPSSTGPLQTVR